MGHIKNACSGEFKAGRDLLPVNIIGQSDLCGKGLLPEEKTFFRAGHGEVDYGLKTADKGIVDITPLVGGQDDQPVIAFYPLEQIGNLLVSVFIMGVADVSPFAEQSVCLVKKQNPIFMLCLVKKPGEVFSVSPMYLDTTRDRSMRNTSLPVCLPSRVAVRVLPVPGGP